MKQASAAPLAEAETLTSTTSTTEGKSLEGAGSTLVTSAGGGGDTIVDSELPSLPTDGVVVASNTQQEQEEPVSLSDISLTFVKNTESS